MVAELEIDGNRVEHFTDIFLRQRFNEHHEFSIRINHDVLESFGSFGLDNSKNLIGKSAVIRLVEKATTSQTAYEFTGIICEIGMAQSYSSTGDLLIKGYSPTILLEDKTRLASFNEKTLTDIVTHTIQAGLSKANCPFSIDPKYSGSIRYKCQYNESSFHFVNRLSSDYGELFYYDGSKVIFGVPPVQEFVEVIYGEDMSDMQLSMHVEPIEAWRYAYASRDGVLVTSRGDDIDGLDNYAKHVVQVSNDLYSDLDELPLIPRVETEAEVKNFVNKAKEAIAARLVVLRGTTNNPRVHIGCAADIKISKRDGNFFKKEDYGVYLVTNITHHITSTGKYYNTFEALSGWVKGIPVYNAAMPIAETQYGWIADNADPDNLGRVRVQLLWQKDDEKTDWIWVMTPDAGPGKDGARGGGFVFRPEIGDRVVVGFVFNSPDRPFVMGSFFHGKSGSTSTSRCITGRSTTASVCIVGDAIHIVDGGTGNKIILEGNGKITMDSTTSIKIKVGSSELNIETSKITIKATDVKIDSTTADIQGSSKAVIKKNDSTYFKAEGSQVTMEAATAEVKGTTEAKMGGPQVKITGTAKTEIKGGIVDINA